MSRDKDDIPWDANSLFSKGLQNRWGHSFVLMGCAQPTWSDYRIIIILVFLEKKNSDWQTPNSPLQQLTIFGCRIKSGIGLPRCWSVPEPNNFAAEPPNHIPLFSQGKHQKNFKTSSPVHIHVIRILSPPSTLYVSSVAREQSRRLLTSSSKTMSSWLKKYW